MPKKRKTEQDNKAKLESLQREFETQLQQQQEKISAFEALQVQQNKEKQNQEATNKTLQEQMMTKDTTKPSCVIPDITKFFGKQP